MACPINAALSEPAHRLSSRLPGEVGKRSLRRGNRTAHTPHRHDIRGSGSSKPHGLFVASTPELVVSHLRLIAQCGVVFVFAGGKCRVVAGDGATSYLRGEVVGRRSERVFVIACLDRSVLREEVVAPCVLFLSAGAAQAGSRYRLVAVQGDHVYGLDLLLSAVSASSALGARTKKRRCAAAASPYATFRLLPVMTLASQPASAVGSSSNFGPSSSNCFAIGEHLTAAGRGNAKKSAANSSELRRSHARTRQTSSIGNQAEAIKQS